MKYAEKETFTLFQGDNREILRELEENSIDSIVTDPPYELGFMGKSWDSTGIAFNVEVWAECLRVLKPGGHLLAFSGSRTYHRMAVAIEDAGFEIRDQIMWIYGSGFPKSLDVSKAIDKGSGENRERQLKFTAWMRSTGITAEQINIATGSSMASHYLTDKSQPAIATADLFDLLRPYLPEIPEEIERLVAERTGIEWTAYKNREIVGQKPSSLGGTVAAGERNQEIIHYHKNKIVDITAPATAEAKQWQGWGTALKPAHEPIVLARKPLIGTVAANVLTYGTGGLNIDGARVETKDKWEATGKQSAPSQTLQGSVDGSLNVSISSTHSQGRWPANVIHDGSDEVVELFPISTNVSKGIRGRGSEIYANGKGFANTVAEVGQEVGYGDSGSAARFFYCAKASKRDRNEGLDGFEAKLKPYGNREEWQIPENGDVKGSVNDKFTTQPQANHHPTVKPTDLMRYLCRLITPPNGVVLDPFMGSGSTGKASIFEGFRFVGIEISEEYLAIAKARIEFAQGEK